MIWSIDIELDELVAESKSGDGTSGNEQQKSSEKDKQVVADLVKKLLVRKVLSNLVCDTEEFSRRPPGLSNQVLVERGSIVAWFSLQVLALTSHTGTSARFERERVSCWFVSNSHV